MTDPISPEVIERIWNNVDDWKALGNRAMIAAVLRAAGYAELVAAADEAKRLADKRHTRICELLEDLLAVRKERGAAIAQRDELAVSEARYASLQNRDAIIAELVARLMRARAALLKARG